MYKSRSFSLFLALILSLSLGSDPAAARGNGPNPLAVNSGTAFTYQGQLKDSGGSPVNATCNFYFSLYDVLTGGSPFGTVPLTGVAVSNGLFTVTLDFGAGAFDGNARWLEIAVQCGSEGGFTTLAPRQALNPTPYAMYSLDTDRLDGFEAGAFQQHYANMLVVAKSGSPYTTITSALDTISDASDTNRYLVYVAPGVYSEQVTMKPYVDIQGSGELTTKITWTGSRIDLAGTVIGADNAGLRFLTVENTGGSAYAIAIYNYSTSPRLVHVTANALGGSGNNWGVFNYRNAAPAMTDVTATASAPASATSTNIGVFNHDVTLTMTSLTASASGGTGANYGVLNKYASVTILNSTISASSASGGYGIGIDNEASSGTYTLKINASQISGSYASIINNTFYFTTYVGVSQLIGGVYSFGTLVCVDDFNGSYTALNTICQ